MLDALYSGHAAFWIHKLYLKSELVRTFSPLGHWIHPASFRWLKTDTFVTAFMRQPPQFVRWSKLWETKHYNYPQPSKSGLMLGLFLPCDTKGVLLELLSQMNYWTKWANSVNFRRNILGRGTRRFIAWFSIVQRLCSLTEARFISSEHVRDGSTAG